MAKAKVVNSSDAVTVIFKGDRRHPEPQTGIIRFPGGHVEVTRTSDNKYWAHVSVDESANVSRSRVGHDYEGYEKLTEEQYLKRELPQGDKVNHVAILVDGPFRESWE